MQFCGWNFGGTDYPINLSVTPPGVQWARTPLTVAVARTDAATGGGWNVRPVAMTWTNRPNGLPDLPLDQVVSAMRDANPPAGGGAGGGAGGLPQLLTQNGNLLSYHGMNGVMCAASALAVFRYELTDTLAFTDALMVVAYNLSQARDGRDVRSIVVHTRDQNSEQVHAEQICYAQIGAFLTLMAARRAAARVGGRHFEPNRNARFDFGRLEVDINVTFAHSQANVDADCAACRATKIALTTFWGPQVVQPVRRGQNVAPVVVNDNRCRSLTIDVAREL